ncbi:MAG TPA: hypothetical protein VJ826_13555 [Candidatus Polarisedimenticolaceae bacterium]|nr:hypothetical protein [Candidatus Polarisedimenticolaceae bacterium]
MPRALRALVVILAIAAFGCATAGADLVDLLVCGSEESGACSSEGACDHCPSCFAAHGHMTSLAASTSGLRALESSQSLVRIERAFTPRVAAQDIFHPPLAVAVSSF